MECLFCKIIKGEIPSYKIYEDEKVLAFLDINPQTNGHTLIIPKQHYKDIDDIDNNTLTHIIDTARKIKKELTEKLKCDGITLTQNNGECQEVKHFHLHIIPYYKEKEKTIDVKEIYDILKK